MERKWGVYNIQKNHHFVHCTFDFTLPFNTIKPSYQDHQVAALMLVQNIKQPTDFPIWRRSFRLESLPAFMKDSNDLASQQAGFKTIATQASHAAILTLAVTVLWITKKNAFCFYTQLWKIHCKCFVTYLGHTVSAKVFQSLLGIRKNGQLFHKCKKHLLGLQDSLVIAQLLVEVQVFEPAHN